MGGGTGGGGGTGAGAGGGQNVDIVITDDGPQLTGQVAGTGSGDEFVASGTVSNPTFGDYY